MTFILVALISLAHFILIRKGGKLRFLLPVLIGGPALFLLFLYAVSMTDRNKDVLYDLPVWLLGALLVPEIFFLALKAFNKARSAN